MTRLEIDERSRIREEKLRADVLAAHPVRRIRPDIAERELMDMRSRRPRLPSAGPTAAPPPRPASNVVLL